MVKQVQRACKKPLVRITIAIVLFLIIGLIVSTRRINYIDEAVVDIIYGLPDQLELILDSISQVASIGAFIGISAVLLILKKFKVAKKLIPSGLIALLLASAAKQIYATERPFVILSDIMERVGQTDSYGFPSGHTALVTAMALSLMTYSQKKYKYLLWGIIVLVALSRIYLGVHTLSDVVGGFLIGYIAAEIVQIVINITDSAKRKK